MIRFLARRRWGRALLIPVAIWCCGYSFAQMLYRRVFRSGTMDPQDILRLSCLWGWDRPEMQMHWDRFQDPEAEEYDSLFDTFKNLGAEHARMFSSTAAKMYGFLLVSIAALSAVMLASVALFW